MISCSIVLLWLSQINDLGRRQVFRSKYECAVGKVLRFKVADVDDGPATPLFNLNLRRTVGSLVDVDVHFWNAIVLVLGNHVYFVIVSPYSVTQSISRLVHIDEGIRVHGDLL